MDMDNDANVREMRERERELAAKDAARPGKTILAEGAPVITIPFPNAASLTVNYGIPGAHFPTFATPWTSIATSNPIEDLWTLGAVALPASGLYLPHHHIVQDEGDTLMYVARTVKEAVYNPSWDEWRQSFAPLSYRLEVVRPAVASSSMDGHKVTVMSLTSFNRAQDEADEPFYKVEVEDESGYVAVVAEDMADALVLVVNPLTGHRAWVNPADDPRNTERFAQIALLSLETVAIQDAEALLVG